MLKSVIKTWLVAFLILFPALSFAWWNDDWNFRKQISLNTTAAGANVQTTLNNYPLLIRLHTGNFQYFLDMQQSGKDLRVVAADDKTPVKFHIERFDQINQMALVWVKLPSITANANTEKVWLYYGNPSAPPNEDAASTFDVNQTLVLHFSEEGTSPQDATAYKNHPAQFNAELSKAAFIGQGAKFNGSSNITLPQSPTLRLVPDKGLTFSAWVKVDGPQAEATVAEGEKKTFPSVITFTENESALSLQVRGTQPVLQWQATDTSVETPLLATFTPGRWHHVAFTAAQNKLNLFVDGAQTAAVDAALTELGSVTIGSGFTGELDEVRLANTVRAVDWIKAMVANQGVESRMLALGEDEQRQSSGSGSYFGIILSNVTIDGWVVIMMLVVMAAISWVVMAFKGFVVGQVRKQNRAFLAAFKTTRDPGKLDAEDSAEDRELESSPFAQALFGKHDHFQGSTIYRIYHSGMQELKHRVGTAVGAQAVLTPQAVESMRAALDASLVRENQKLNSQMVLLTIAISGGPFLGLLGTVVGVMITFAAIAASGDVNINAIAPGIAAALVATVAGLAVAIPALFGYNYLSSRVKEITADMQVFVDEFITRMAEHYS